MLTRRFAKFLIAGGIAAVVNFVARIALSHWMTYALAIFFAYILGMLVAFILNRLFVFRVAANSLRSQVWWFIVVNVTAVLQTLLISIALADYILPAIGLLAHRETVAHAIGVLTPAVTSYFGHRYLSFRDSDCIG